MRIRGKQRSPGYGGGVSRTRNGRVRDRACWAGWLASFANIVPLYLITGHSYTRFSRVAFFFPTRSRRYTTLPFEKKGWKRVEVVGPVIERARKSLWSGATCEFLLSKGRNWVGWAGWEVITLTPSVNRGSVSFFESFEFFEMEFYILYFMLVDGMKGFFFRIVNLRR